MASLESDYNLFIGMDDVKYKGMWVAIVGNKIVSFGKDVKKVSEKAKKIVKSNKFLLVKVPSKETLIF